VINRELERSASVEEEDLEFLVWGTDQRGDRHLFATSDLSRALAVHAEMSVRFEMVRVNKAVADALSRQQMNS